MSRHSKCSHTDSVLQLSLSELYKIKQGIPCTQCQTKGPNLWLCLYSSCMHIGCSEEANDHSTIHFNTNQTHCLHMNLSTQRIWCYLCKMEVFLQNKRRPSMISNESTSDTSRNSERIIIYDRGGAESCDSSGDEDDGDRRNYGSGLIGLQNIANTCYMNSALQALSNTPPLTGYFLECGDIIEATSDSIISLPMSSQRKTGLARSYHRLVKDMWRRNKRSNGFVVPSGILNGIRNVHPMFRGYQQHDTQEFLRCFMDQLHEELKEITPPPPETIFKNQPGKKLSNYDNIASLFNSNLQLDNHEEDDNRSQCSSDSSLSQSEAEYETCDSGVSEQSSLSDEQMSSDQHHYQQQQQQQIRFSRSPSPTNNTTYQRHKSSNNSNSNRSNSANSSSSAKQQQQQQEKKQPPHRSIISDVFDGKLLSSVQCLTCDRISTREETFQDLSLPIPGKDHLTVLHQSQGILQQPPPTGITCTDAVYQVTQEGWIWWILNWVRSFFWGPAVSLHDCMAAFFSADELKGDNMYSCEKCNKLRNGIKFSRVLELPEMLCVHLKRFRHDLSYSSKIASPVNFPLRGLDMSAYLHKDCKSEISTYDLTAVICHHGTVGGGHYTCFAKHESTGKWYEYDDQLVTEVSEELVQSCEAYVLFYRKSNPNMSKIRLHAANLLEKSSASDMDFFISKQWLNRFKTFAEPGPIDNWALLCPHGAIPPNKAPIISQLLVPLRQPLWDFLYKTFGGGPACNHFYECEVCRNAANLLARRKNAELDAFQQYRNESTLPVYAISMGWFRQWQLFVNSDSAFICLVNDEPGPINNSSIAGPIENGRRTVRPNSDFAQINSTLWTYFFNIYGGGPEIIMRGAPEDREPDRKSIREQIDAMDVDDTPPPPSITNESNKNISKSQYQSDELKNNIDMSIEMSQNIPITDEQQTIIPKNVVYQHNDSQQQKKIGKSVSFEDNNSENGNISIASTETIDTISNNSTTTSSIKQNKKTKHHNLTASQNENIFKKDKRHGITTNGLFGPEGKYSQNTSSTSNIPNNNSSTSKFSPTPLCSSPTISTSNFQQNSNQTQQPHHTNTNGSLPEMIPLLKQTSDNCGDGGGGDAAAVDDKEMTTVIPAAAIEDVVQNISEPHSRKSSSKHKKKFKGKSKKSSNHNNSHHTYHQHNSNHNIDTELSSNDREKN